MQVIVISHILFLQEAEVDQDLAKFEAFKNSGGPLQELAGEGSLSILRGSVGKKIEAEFPDIRKTEEIAAMKADYPGGLQG